MKIERVHFYCRDAARTKDWFVRNIGFKAIGKYVDGHSHTELVVLGSACFLFSSPLSDKSPVARYLAYHPTGVADITFRVKDLGTIIDRSKNLGLKILQDIHSRRSPQNNTFKSAKITGWNDLQHTLIEAQDDGDLYLPMAIEPYYVDDVSPSHITGIDHVVLNVARGKLSCAVELYQKLFNFKVQQSFNIQTSKSGLTSQALIDDSGQVQFNINQPSGANSQIQEFIDYNGGSGIQHLALRSQNLIADIAQIQSGLRFLTVPQAYYQNLKPLSYLNLAEQEAVARLQILVDSDYTSPQSLLMQIFTQPIFEQPTFFLEFIERRQSARGFGRGNFKALFEAVERQSEHRLSIHTEDKKTVHS